MSRRIFSSIFAGSVIAGKGLDKTYAEKPGFGYRTSCNGKCMKFDGVSLNTKS